MRVLFRLVRDADQRYRLPAADLSVHDRQRGPAPRRRCSASATSPFRSSPPAITRRTATSPPIPTTRGPASTTSRVTIGASGQAWAYYGCYLNVYPTDNTIGGSSVQALLPSTHSCLVAQIAYDDAPIINDRPGRGPGTGILRQASPAQPADHLFRQPRAAVHAPGAADLRHAARAAAPTSRSADQTIPMS